MNSSSYGHLGMFPFYAERLRCSNALVLRDIVCVLTILIMGACSCFIEMACVIRQARKSPLSHPKSIVKALATRLILKRVTQLHKTLKAEAQHLAVTSKFKRHSITNLEVLTIV